MIDKGFKSIGEAVGGVVILAVVIVVAAHWLSVPPHAKLSDNFGSYTIPTPPSLSQNPEVDTSNWLTYTNPTYHITLKYPPFYKYTKRTVTFEAGSEKDILNSPDYLKIRVILEPLAKVTYTVCCGQSSGLSFRYDTTTGLWKLVKGFSSDDGPNDYSYDAPKLHMTLSNLQAWVAGYSAGSAVLGGTNGTTAYIESPDKKFTVQIDLNYYFCHGDGYTDQCTSDEPHAQATDQTIYQILDTLEIDTPVDMTGWKTYQNHEFEIRYPKELILQLHTYNDGISLSENPNGNDVRQITIEKIAQSVATLIQSYQTPKSTQDDCPIGTLSTTKVKIGDILATKLINGASYGGCLRDQFIFIPYGSTTYVLGGSDDSLVSTIFSTFKFTN